ncbi:MAG: hypothetical protein CVU48_10995 [Candidatus Cloacimonetes bacterium HGW-Cloacimonetes-1]|jgi:multicomponent Na+:H+ antiporter subunit E|nr:MAG: hypothetical protein CVU48_10995 [Candidatus Cloacimonetes bacterium HGW-Cloacimonetes-1]
MRRVKAFVLSYIILIGLWMIVGGTQPDEMIVGAITAFIISLVFAPRFALLGSIRLSPKALFATIMFIIVFSVELVKGAIDVAGRVISPSLPINPGIVKVRTRLQSDVGRIALANAITMTPGTMTVETNGEFFYIHWIDIKSEDIDAATAAIVTIFERHLEVMFG